MRFVASAVLAAVFVARAANAQCLDTDASCAMQAEATELLVAGRYAEAEQRFLASIAAQPSARGYLGYAQAVEALGKLGLAYDSLLTAKELSSREERGDEAESRAERIAYKFAELEPRVSFVRLRLPTDSSGDQIIEVSRAGEGLVADMPEREIPVTPNQRLDVVLRSGARVSLYAPAVSGQHVDIVVPIAATGPVPYARDAAPLVPRRPNKSLGVGPRIVIGSDNVGPGFGGGARFERVIAPWLDLVVSADAAYHPQVRRDAMDVAFEAYEFTARVGLRTARVHLAYAACEFGALYFARTATAPAAAGLPTLTESYHDIYPAITIGGGLRIGRIDFGLAVLVTPVTGSDSLPARALLSLGYEVFER